MNKLTLIGGKPKRIFLLALVLASNILFFKGIVQSGFLIDKTSEKSLLRNEVTCFGLNYFAIVLPIKFYSTAKSSRDLAVEQTGEVEFFSI